MEAIEEKAEKKLDEKIVIRNINKNAWSLKLKP